jgi:Ser/Thr protein kinase RdoA (MazF antagonist)
MSLLDACETLYGLEGYSLRPLVGGVSDHTYVLEHPSADPFVLRVARSDRGDMPIHEQVLLYLEERGYPAPRVIRALDGYAAVQHDGAMIVLTTYIDGLIVESDANSPASLHQMGAVIGRLHALTPLPGDLPEADFMPENQVGWAEGRLAEVADRVPLQWQHRVDEMRERLASTPSLVGLPACLIHNDCHPGNAVRRADREITLIDWDGAGLGASVLDLGFLLIAADTHTPDVPATGESTERVNAIVDGYCRYRILDTAELDHLADAICYRVTFINAVTFARQVERGQLDQLSTSWWDGCTVADELTARVRGRFDERRASGKCAVNLRGVGEPVPEHKFRR